MPPKSRSCVKMQRPGWWTPAEVLERLNSGMFITDICQSALDELAGVGVQMKVTTLRSDIAKWKESLSYGEQFTAALSLWKHAAGGKMVLDKSWHDDFIAAMDACEGNAERAAALAGINYGIVLAVLDPRHKCYDAEFAERFRVAELPRVGRIRERYMQTAEEGDGKSAARAQERIIEASLPGLHGQRQEVRVTGKVKHEHEHDHEHRHLHTLTAEMAQEVVLASQDRMRRITSGRVRELPAGPADTGGEVIEVKARQAVEVLP